MTTDTSQTSARIQGSTRKVSTIGVDLLIAGNVSSDGEIRLEGRVQGDIQCSSLILGENSQLEGL
jgi:cytoskeletal protein CcmA (bactofilin family)